MLAPARQQRVTVPYLNRGSPGPLSAHADRIPPLVARALPRAAIRSRRPTTSCGSTGERPLGRELLRRRDIPGLNFIAEHVVLALVFERKWVRQVLMPLLVQREIHHPTMRPFLQIPRVKIRNNAHRRVACLGKDDPGIRLVVLDQKWVGHKNPSLIHAGNIHAGGHRGVEHGVVGQFRRVEQRRRGVLDFTKEDAHGVLPLVLQRRRNARCFLLVRAIANGSVHVRESIVHSRNQETVDVRLPPPP